MTDAQPVSIELRHLRYFLAVAEARRAGGADSVLRIGCSPYIPIAWTQRFLAALRKRVPSVEPQVSHLLFNRQVTRLQAGDLDIGIFRYAVEIDGIETARIDAGEPLAAFLPADHRLAVKPVLRPDDFADQTLIMLPRSLNTEMYDWMLAALAQAGHHFRSVRETAGADPRDVLVAVSSGLGVGVAPSSFSGTDGPGSALAWRPLAPAVMTADTNVAWRQDLPGELGSIVEAIRDLGREWQEAGEHEGN